MTHLKYIFISGALLLAHAGSYAQQETVDTAAFNRIRKAELSSSQIPQIAHYLTDVSGARLTNSPGYARAANWAVATMKKWGLANAATERWGTFGKAWEVHDFSMMMRAPYNAQIRAYPTPWSPSSKGQLQGGVVVITPTQSMDTAYLNNHAAEYKGKFVLVTGTAADHKKNFEPSAERLTDTALANLKDTYMVPRGIVTMYNDRMKVFKTADMILKNAGALAFISAGRNNVNGTVFVQGYYGYKLTDPETIPQLSIALEDAQKIKRLLQSGQKVELSMSFTGKSSAEDTNGYNVVGEIPGTDHKLKSQLVMLGGHLDSWQAATGATDNAAGCIVMLEAVRLLDSLGLKPKRTIRIALWSGEEQGLLGSFGYVKNHFRDGAKFTVKPEQAKVSAYFNLDNGTGKIRGIYAQSNEKMKPIFEQWLKPFNDLGATAVTLANTGSTDHLSFDWAGIPGFQFVQDPIDYETRTHHSNMDDYDHLMIDDLKQAAIIVASFVYQASIRPEMLPRKPIENETFVFDGF